MTFSFPNICPVYTYMSICTYTYTFAVFQKYSLVHYHVHRFTQYRVAHIIFYSSGQLWTIKYALFLANV